MSTELQKLGYAPSGIPPTDSQQYAEFPFFPGPPAVTLPGRRLPPWSSHRYSCVEGRNVHLSYHQGPPSATSSEPLLDEEEQERRMEKKRRRLMADPDGNLYRGWAVSIHHGPRLFFMTGLVVTCMVLGPIMMVLWGHATMCSGKVQRLDTYLWQLQNHTNVTLANRAATGLVDIPTLTETHPGLAAVMLKILGLALMTIVYLNGEMLLDRMDRQTDRLRYLFGRELKFGWMWVDAFCNSWCIAVCAFATPFLVWSAADVKDVVLDAFGLMFLAGLDEYSAIIEFGIETSDFDELVDEKEDEKELERARYELRASEDQEGLEAGVLSRSITYEQHVSCTNRLKYGDFCFWMARLINLVAASFGIPAYMCFKWVPASELGNHPWMMSLPNAAPFGVVFCSPQVVTFATLVIVAIYALTFCDWYSQDLTCEGNRSVSNFVYRVLFRGHAVDGREIFAAPEETSYQMSDSDEAAHLSSRD